MTSVVSRRLKIIMHLIVLWTLLTLSEIRIRHHLCVFMILIPDLLFGSIDDL